MHGSDEEDWGEELPAEEAVYYTLKETLVYSNTHVRKECGPGPASFGTYTAVKSSSGMTKNATSRLSFVMPASILLLSPVLFFFLFWPHWATQAGLKLEVLLP